MRKACLILIALVLMVSVIVPSVQVHATTEEHSGACGDNLTWEYDGGVLTISGTGPMWDEPEGWEYLDVQKVILEDGVTSIGQFAFSSCGMTEVSIPNSVTVIAAGAFYKCWKLAEIVIPESVTQIGDRAFEDCSSLKKATIQGNIQALEPRTFYMCVELTQVALPASLTSIGDYAFKSCIEMEALAIPEGVTKIGAKAFDYCKKLTQISMPNSMASIASDAFTDCARLQYNTYENSDYLGNESNPYAALIRGTYNDPPVIHPDTKLIAAHAFKSR